MSWKWEMQDSGKWITNQVRFATNAEAEMYGTDLAFRWMAMPTPARAAHSDDPVNYKYREGRAIPIKEENDDANV